MFEEANRPTTPLSTVRRISFRAPSLSLNEQGDVNIDNYALSDDSLHLPSFDIALVKP